MKNDLVHSAVEGFVGSFKLAAMIVVAVVGVLSGFVNDGRINNQNATDSKLHQ